MNDNNLRIRSVDIWARCVAIGCILWGSASLIYLVSLTRGQPKHFTPLQINDIEPDELRADIIQSWLADALPNNLHSLVRDDAYERHFSVTASAPVAVEANVKTGTKAEILEQNERADWYLRSYWAIASYLKQYAILTTLAGFLALWRVRIVFAILLTGIATLGLPSFTRLFSGPFESSFPSSTYLLAVPLLTLGLIFSALAVYRWRLMPISNEMSHDWKMLRVGVVCLALGSVVIAAIFIFKARRIPTASGLPAAYGLYLIVRHGWRLFKHYRAANKSVEAKGDLNG